MWTEEGEEGAESNSVLPVSSALGLPQHLDPLEVWPTAEHVKNGSTKVVQPFHRTLS